MAVNLDFKVKNGLVVSSTATILSTTQSVSTTTGALQVSGGVGIRRDVWIGGNLNVAGGITANITGVSSQVQTTEQPANANYFPVFVDSNNSSATGENLFTTSSFVINPSTGNAGIGGSVSPIYRLKVTTVSQGVDGIEVGNGSRYVSIRPNMGAGTNNNITQLGDGGIIFSAGTTGTGAFVIAPWANDTSGIRINSSGTVSIGTAGGDFSRNWRFVARQDQNASSEFGFINATTGTTAAVNLSKIGGTANSFINWQLVDNNGAPYDQYGYGSAVQSVRWNFGGPERARLTSTGNFLLGRTYTGNERVGIGGGTTASGESGIYNDVTVSSATNAYTSYNSYISTQATSFTLNNLIHFKASQFTVGANSTITNQYGFFADGTMTGATNDYGFYSGIASGLGRWNFYAGGTASNYFAGQVMIGDTTSSNVTLFLNGTAQITGITTVTNTTNATSTTTGALVVSGGVGIGGNLHVGGDVVANRLIIQLTTITTTLVQTDDVIQTLNTSNATSTITGALQVAGGAGIGRDLYVGGTIYGNISGTLTGNAATVSTVQRTTDASHFLTFVDSNNASATAENVYTTSTLAVNPSSGNVGIGTASPGVRLDVQGGDIRLDNNRNLSFRNVASNATTNFVHQNDNNFVVYNASNTPIMSFSSATNAYVTYGAGNNQRMIVDAINSVTTFISSGTERLRINSSGNVGINQSSPQALLHIGPTTTDNTGYIVGSVSHYFRFITIPVKTAITATSETFSVYLGRTSNGITTLNLYSSGWNMEEGCIFEIHRDWGLSAVPTIKSRRGSVLGELTLHYTTATADSYDLHLEHTYQAGVPTGQSNNYRIEIINNGLSYFSVPTGVTTSTTSTNLIATDHNINSAGLSIIGNTTNATSTATGALQVSGGAGIGRDMYVGGTIYGNISGGTITATNFVLNGVALSTSSYSFSTAYVDSFISNGTTTTYVLTAAPTNKNSVSVILDGVTQIQNTYNVSGSNLILTDIQPNGISIDVRYTVSGTASQIPDATNIKNGGPGQVVYQSSTGTTAFVSTGTSGQLLQSNGTGAPTWVSPSGFQGIQGIQGTTGTGLQGIQGITGNQGIQGITGGQGTQGVTGTGLQGIQGITGNQGTQGVQGRQGIQGITGNQGIQGITGAGFQGIQGITGSQGVQGIAGAGSQGIQGITGGQGTQGVTGAGFQGIQGITGSQGVQGTQGVQGRQGIQGTTGAGSQGIQGITGSQGVQGITGTGNQGTQGIQGITGSQGVQGITGSQGVQGITGTINSSTLMTTSVNLAGGAAGQVPYQSGAGTTAFIAAGSSGQLLQSNGTGAPTWVTPTGLTAGSATTASQINTVLQTTNASHFLTFVDANNASATAESLYTTSTLVVNPSTSRVGINTNSPVVTLDVRGVIQGQAYAVPDTGGVAQWVRLGTLTIPQNGFTAHIRAYIHEGYNAVNTQDFYVDIFFKTSNSVSVDSNGFGANSWYYTIGNNLSNPTPKWVGNNTGTNATSYDLFLNLPQFTFNSHYIVELSQGCTWSHVGTIGATAPGIDSATTETSSLSYNIPIGNVGIGTVSPSARLEVAGTTRITGVATVTNTTQAISTLTGALVVSGGVGIGGNIFAGGTITATNVFIGPWPVSTGTINSSTLMTTSVNLAGGAAGQVPYQSGAGTTAFIAAGSSGQLLQSNGTGAPTWVLPSSIISGNFVVVSGTTQTAATGTYYAMVNASTSTLTLPASPATGSIVGVTFTNGRTTNVIARNGQLIMGSALDLIVDDPDRSIELRYIDATNGWRLNNAAIVNVVSTSTIASVITTVQQNSNAAYYPTFVDSNNSTLQSESLFTTSSFVINPSTGNVGIGTTSPASKLDAYTSGATSTIIRARNDTTSVYLDANNGYAYLNVFTNHPLLIGTNNTERIRVTSTGAISFGSSGTATGTSGQVLTSNGSSSSPSWTTLLSTPDFLLLNSGII